MGPAATPPPARRRPHRSRPLAQLPFPLDISGFHIGMTVPLVRQMGHGHHVLVARLDQQIPPSGLGHNLAEIVRQEEAGSLASVRCKNS